MGLGTTKECVVPEPTGTSLKKILKMLWRPLGLECQRKWRAMAAQTYGISPTTIARKLLGRNMQPVGHPKVLSSQEEASIAETLGVVANWGFPLTRLDMRTVIAKYLEKQGERVAVFKNNIREPSERKTFTKREIFNMMQQQNQMNINEKLDFVEDYFINTDNFTEDDKKDIKKKFSRLKSEFKRRWSEASYKEDIFMGKTHAWLNTIAFDLPKPSRIVGRPSKTFHDSSESSKRRKTETLRKSNESQELLCAAQVELQVEGKRDASKILRPEL
ncbi:hypothetical protein NQ314_008850 [Rhamnusium bicolor]|uniref:Uncharacterized protein n=1 Tax=Rhamnusium bicolor TaxID=1586634 RepID=A0AAV8Y6N5_9CUCU|nr:hypothetical protein NQ314_008850 [Rhamnusium bicolor]